VLIDGEGIKMKKIDKVRLVILLVLVSTISILIFKNWGFIRRLSVHKLVRYIDSKGPLSALVFITIFALKPFFLVLPSAMISVVGGILFGPVKGLLLSVVGFYLSGTIAYWISRFLGRSFVEKLLGKRALALDNNLETSGFKILLLLRLPPVLPYDPLSYACGLTKIKYWDFILASVIGILPETTCYSFLGRNMFKPLSPQFLIPLAFIIFATISSTYFFSKSKKLSDSKN